MNASVNLKNTKNGEIIWTAEGFSVGNTYYTSFSDLTANVAETTMKELFYAGLITQKKTKSYAKSVK
ncbi:MAG: hypothetical protein HRK26_04220 [Rickettsiaceae bacterium H1]|nr:hypothetical protein [Rickettsiaceae bacterium H1]